MHLPSTTSPHTQPLEITYVPLSSILSLTIL
jgi:hypothetical protein